MQKTSEQRLGEIADRYIAATGVTGIVVVEREPPGSYAMVVPASETKGSGVGKFAEGATAGDERWFSNATVAARVMARAFQDRTGVAMLRWSLAEAMERIVGAAQDLGVEAFDGLYIHTMGQTAAKAILEEAERLRLSGGLKGLNAAFKEARKTWKGESPLVYADWLHDYHLRAAGQAGARIRSKLRFSTT